MLLSGSLPFPLNGHIVRLCSSDGGPQATKPAQGGTGGSSTRSASGDARNAVRETHLKEG